MEDQANKDIRATIKKCNLKHWKLAQIMGISETTLVRKLRTELKEHEKEKILKIIFELSNKN